MKPSAKLQKEYREKVPWLPKYFTVTQMTEDTVMGWIKTSKELTILIHLCEKHTRSNFITRYVKSPAEKALLENKQQRIYISMNSVPVNKHPFKLNKINVLSCGLRDNGAQKLPEHKRKKQLRKGVIEKVDCPARIVVRFLTIYDGYTIPKNITINQKRSLVTDLKFLFSVNPDYIPNSEWYFVSLPLMDAHRNHSFPPVCDQNHLSMNPMKALEMHSLDFELDTSLDTSETQEEQEDQDKDLNEEDEEEEHIEDEHEILETEEVNPLDDEAANLQADLDNIQDELSNHNESHTPILVQSRTELLPNVDDATANMLAENEEILTEENAEILAKDVFSELIKSEPNDNIIQADKNELFVCAGLAFNDSSPIVIKSSMTSEPSEASDNENLMEQLDMELDNFDCGIDTRHRILEISENPMDHTPLHNQPPVIPISLEDLKNEVTVNKLHKAKLISKRKAKEKHIQQQIRASTINAEASISLLKKINVLLPLCLKKESEEVADDIANKLTACRTTLQKLFSNLQEIDSRCVNENQRLQEIYYSRLKLLQKLKQQRKKLKRS